MLQQAIIKNFESHAHSEITFEPGINVVIGLSDAGKSALFRAIQWALFNHPTGDAFVRKGESVAEVSVAFSDGHTVTRRKTKSSNLYYLDKREYKAFGSDVPEDIVQAINLDRGLNVQGQIDPIYLLQASPGEVARHWNDMAHLDAIDRSLSQLQGWERSAKSEWKRESERVKSLESSLAEYEGLDDLEVKLQEAEEQQERANALRETRQGLYNAIRKTREATEKIEELKPILAWQGTVEEAENLRETLERKRREEKRLVEAANRYRTSQYHINKLEAKAQWSSTMDKATALRDELKDKRQQRERWKRVIKAIQSASEAVQSAKDRLEGYESEWHEKAPDTCPLCNGTGRLN